MKLELYHPLKPLIQTQKFGETAMLAYYKENGLSFPGHNGIDYAAPHGTPVRASHDGFAYYEIDDRQGHGVVLITDDKFDFEDGKAFFKTIYWHLCDPVKEPHYASPVRHATLAKPIYVRAGDIIGYVDSTGLSTGHHLHFGVKPVAKGEPANTWGNLRQNNGYYGAIDPAPYFNGIFAEDVQIKPITKNLAFGYRGTDVGNLQRVLKRIGLFNHPEITENYGEKTMAGVLEFQLKTGIVTFPIESWWGWFCGPKTRDALNKLF